MKQNNKCSKGKVKVRGRCVTKREKKILGKFADDYVNLKAVIIGTISAFGAYLIYLSLKVPINKIFNMEEANPIILFIIGVAIITSTYFIKKRKN